MNTLFELPEEKRRTLKSEFRCRNCKHSYKHEYGKMHYCAVQKGIGTAYGDKKIKMNDSCCDGLLFSLK
jgi:hypothetical protein